MTSLPEEMPEHVVHEKFLEQILENKEEIEDFIHKIIVESKYTQTISPRILKTLITHCQSEVLLVRHSYLLTRRLSGYEILNNATSIFQKWLVSRIFGNIFHYLNFPEEY